MKRVLITGATGFCGRHLARYLASLGYGITGTYFLHHEAHSFSAGDLVRLNIQDARAVEALVRKIRPDAVCHLAAQSSAEGSWHQEAETFRSNVVGTLHLLQGLRKFSPRARFLLASTTQVYGKSFSEMSVITEQSRLWPLNPYAASKVLAEFSCLDFAGRFGIPVLLARPFNHTGAGQAPSFVFSDWCRQIALAEAGLREPVLQVGNLEVERDFLHVEDVVRAYELILRSGEPGRVYNVCTGQTRVLRDYADFLLWKSEIRLALDFQADRMRTQELKIMRGSAARLRELGWEPRRTIFDALEELLEDWRHRVRVQKEKA